MMSYYFKVQEIHFADDFLLCFDSHWLYKNFENKEIIFEILYKGINIYNQSFE